ESGKCGESYSAIRDQPLEAVLGNGVGRIFRFCAAAEGSQLAPGDDLALVVAGLALRAPIRERGLPARVVAGHWFDLRRSLELEPAPAELLEARAVEELRLGGQARAPSHLGCERVRGSLGSARHHC